MPRKRKSQITRSKSTRRTRPLTLRQQEERVKCLAAIRRYRRGEAKSLSAAARTEEITVKTIRALLPGAILQDRPGGRIRVKGSDRYSARVEILSIFGPEVTKARGSRQRELAGQHRSIALRALRGQEPPSSLERFRGKTVGGRELISDFERLSSFAHAGILGNLDSLYVGPDVSA